VSSTRPRAVLHIRSPISWLFLHDVVGNIQLSESSETAAGRNDGWGRGNRSGATRVPQFSKVKVLRIVTDLGRTKVFVLHHRNARHKRGFNPKAVGRSGVAKTNRGEKKPSRLGESAFQISFKAAHMALAYLFKYHRENIFIVLSSGRQGRRATHRRRTWSGRRAGTRHREKMVADRHWNAPAANLLHGCALARRDDATRWTASRVSVVSMDPLLRVEVVDSSRITTAPRDRSPACACAVSSDFSPRGGRRSNPRVRESQSGLDFPRRCCICHSGAHSRPCRGFDERIGVRSRRAYGTETREEHTRGPIAQVRDMASRPTTRYPSMVPDSHTDGSHGWGRRGNVHPVRHRPGVRIDERRRRCPHPASSGIHASRRGGRHGATYGQVS